MGAQQMVLVRDVTPEECPWLEAVVIAGSIVWTFHKATYGCVNHATGRAVSLCPDEYPFFELPKDALEVAP